MCHSEDIFLMLTADSGTTESLLTHFLIHVTIINTMHTKYLFFSFATPFPVNTRKIISPLHFRISHCMNALPFTV